MALHMRRGVVESAVTCEWLLRRVDVEVDMNVHGGYDTGGGGTMIAKTTMKIKTKATMTTTRAA